MKGNIIMINVDVDGNITKHDATQKAEEGMFIGELFADGSKHFDEISNHINLANDAFFAIDMYCKGVENSSPLPYINYETFLNIIIAAGYRKI